MKVPITHVFPFNTIRPPLNMPLDKRNAMLCKSFEAILYHSTSKWFSDLKLSSITYFYKLVRLFVIIIQVTSHWKQSYTIYSLLFKIWINMSRYLWRGFAKRRLRYPIFWVPSLFKPSEECVEKFKFIGQIHKNGASNYEESLWGNIEFC